MKKKSRATAPGAEKRRKTVAADRKAVKPRAASAVSPRLPVAPNRTLLITGVLFAGIGAGLAITILLGQLDRSFSTTDELRSLGLPVLGGISVLGLIPLRQRMLAVMRFGAAVAVLVCIYGGLLVHILRSSALI